MIKKEEWILNAAKDAYCAYLANSDNDSALLPINFLKALETFYDAWYEKYGEDKLKIDPSTVPYDGGTFLIGNEVYEIKRITSVELITDNDE